ncbi:MAG: PIN domain-containing protein, partial [Candidatus Tectomicrobia bacterium]|nr:PIN domain-containing protein [Candidatus Tectomicrobia bacterium]
LVLEYEEVLLRKLPHLQVPRTVVDDVLDFHCTVATHHPIFFLWRPYLPDPSDDMLLELAVTARCDFLSPTTHGTLSVWNGLPSG